MNHSHVDRIVWYLDMDIVELIENNTKSIT